MATPREDLFNKEGFGVTPSQVSLNFGVLLQVDCHPNWSPDGNGRTAFWGFLQNRAETSLLETGRLHCLQFRVQGGKRMAAESGVGGGAAAMQSYRTPGPCTLPRSTHIVGWTEAL